MSIKNHKGSILISIIIFAGIFSLLALNLLKLIFLFTKSNELKIVSDNEFYALENIAMKQVKTGNSNCIINIDNPNQAIEYLKHNKGCTHKYEGKIYKFFIEDLGKFTCVTFKDNRETQHQRITIISPTMKLLQIRYANVLSNTQIQSCLNHTYINSKILSWRYINL